MTFLIVEDINTPTLILIVLGAALCLLSYILRLAAHVFTYTRGTAIVNFRLTLIVTFLGYFGWG